MQLSSVYLFEVGSQKAQWLSARQTAIAANVANANTPGYHAVDIQPFSAVLELVTHRIGDNQSCPYVPAPIRNGRVARGRN